MKSVLGSLAWQMVSSFGAVGVGVLVGAGVDEGSGVGDEDGCGAVGATVGMAGSSDAQPVMRLVSSSIMRVV